MSDTVSASGKELDLAIPDMDSDSAEQRVKEILEGLPGIDAVRLVSRGAWIRHHPETITDDQICIAIRQAGYRVSIFQNSAGRMGRSSQ